AIACYSLTKKFPDSERYGLVQQIRRAVISIHLNIAEGCSRRSFPERRRYFEIARGSSIEIDAALDLAYDLGFSTIDEMGTTGNLLVRVFKMLSSMMETN
ncbi:MAG: four helix bundle protein, partial [Saprospiraceae bacterium]